MKSNILIMLLAFGITACASYEHQTTAQNERYEQDQFAQWEGYGSRLR